MIGKSRAPLLLLSSGGYYDYLSRRQGIASKRFFQVTTALASAAALYFGAGSINQGAQLDQAQHDLVDYKQLTISLNNESQVTDKLLTLQQAKLAECRKQLPPFKKSVETFAYRLITPALILEGDDVGFWTWLRDLVIEHDSAKTFR